MEKARTAMRCHLIMLKITPQKIGMYHDNGAGSSGFCLEKPMLSKIQIIWQSVIPFNHSLNSTTMSISVKFPTRHKNHILWCFPKSPLPQVTTSQVSQFYLSVARKSPLPNFLWSRSVVSWVIGVPPSHHPLIDGIFHDKPSIWRYPHCWKYLLMWFKRWQNGDLHDKPPILELSPLMATPIWIHMVLFWNPLKKPARNSARFTTSSAGLNPLASKGPHRSFGSLPGAVGGAPIPWAISVSGHGNPKCWSEKSPQFEHFGLVWRMNISKLIWFYPHFCRFDQHL